MDYNTVEKRRAYYIQNFGSVRLWAFQAVANNWRIRKRLPRLTAKAVELGLLPV